MTFGLRYDKYGQLAATLWPRVVAMYATFSSVKRIFTMLKYCVKATEALKDLRTDEAGVVSFEYIIVAACIVGAVAAAFGTGAAGGIATALTTGITAVTTAFTAAI
jgi:hypothetical protein